MSSAAGDRELGQVCSSSGIPPPIAEGYRNLGISHLYEWQLDCIRTTSVLEGRNLVYCAPTSGGKTLVAELALLKQSTSTRRKTIFILPFVSLIIEKERHLKKILRQYNASLSREDRIRVKGYYGEKSKFQFKEQILLCTIEKANIILNRLIESDMKNGLLGNGRSSIGCVVIDEMHMMGDAFRGYLLEIFVRFDYISSNLIYSSHPQQNQLSSQAVSGFVRAPSDSGRGPVGHHGECRGLSPVAPRRLLSHRLPAGSSEGVRLHRECLVLL